VANLLAIDLGTSSVKVIITDEHGSILGRASIEYPMLQPLPGWVEQSVDDWWQASIMAIQHALHKLNTVPRIDAIGLSGQMHGTVLLDDSGLPLRNAIIWPDQRSSAQVEEMNRLVGRERMIEITGSIAATGFQAASLVWIQQNEPHLWKKTRWVLLPKDYLRWRLCGEFSTDPSDASGSGLFDGARRNWSQDLLKVLDTEVQSLPQVVPSFQKVGVLLPDAARDSGLSAGIPIIVGAADTAASLLGAGITKPGQLLVTISTGGQLLTPSESFIADPEGRLHSFCSALEPAQGCAAWYLMGATLSAGKSLQWLLEAVFQLRNQEGYSQLIAWAEQSSIGADGLIFMPYLSGERSPDSGSQLPGAFIGLTKRHGRPEIVRSVLEGVVYALYEKYLVLVEKGIQSEKIVFAGGGARSSLWTQIVADVFGLPVEKLQIEDQSAYGAALLAGAGAGIFSVDEGVKAWRKTAAWVEPNRAAHAQYREMFSIFQRFKNKLRALPQ
jgi:xylulokinase